MPADTPMVLVPRSAAETAVRIIRAFSPTSEAASELEAALSASPVGEGLGASASPIPTEQAGGPVVVLRSDDFDEHGFARTPLACMAVAARTLRSIPAFGGDGEAVVWCVSDDVPDSITVALSYIDAAIKELSAPASAGNVSQWRGIETDFADVAMRNGRELVEWRAQARRAVDLARNFANMLRAHEFMVSEELEADDNVNRVAWERELEAMEAPPDAISPAEQVGEG